jgi:hypothetical protein
MSYNAARIMVRKAGRLVGIHPRPHDLRRHSATFASRSRTPIEIVSKLIMRHALIFNPLSMMADMCLLMVSPSDLSWPAYAPGDNLVIMRDAAQQSMHGRIPR